jgi:hypothetical protein
VIDLIVLKVLYVPYLKIYMVILILIEVPWVIVVDIMLVIFVVLTTRGSLVKRRVMPIGLVRKIWLWQLAAELLLIIRR